MLGDLITSSLNRASMHKVTNIVSKAVCAPCNVSSLSVEEQTFVRYEKQRIRYAYHMVKFCYAIRDFVCTLYTIIMD